jgi:L-alanine-DL-glutamate epimerase-like enolase superfamily enzyme
LTGEVIALVAGADWRVEVFEMDLALAERFTISSASWESARNVFVVVSRDGISGVGEASPDPRAGESAASVARTLEDVDLVGLAGPFDLEGVSGVLEPGAARCALDIALHDLAGKVAGMAIADLLGCGGRMLPLTSVTVPIGGIDEMVARAQSLTDHPILKMKVGFEGDVDAVRSVREIYPGVIRIDANEGWDVDTAKETLAELDGLDIELCEQPVAAADVDGLAEVTAATSIPIFADESAHTSRDVARLSGAVDGVNLKLRKAGGIRETVKAIAVARALGMHVMLGCDLESGVAATAEAHVSPLADYADLDGPLLLADDPWPGVSYARGAMTLPAGPGLGLIKSPP